VPYAFAHPAAVIPLGRLLGKFAVPSALVIGSVIPDAWYFVPFLSREHSHSVGGLFLFCLPAGLIAYAAFHLIFKQPLLALLPNGLASPLRTYACPSLPAAPWRAVAGSLIAGILTHLAWDALTHPGFPGLEMPVLTVGHYPLRAHQLLQHASTLLGTTILIGWIWRKLRAAPHSASPVHAVPAPARAAIVVSLLGICVAAFWSVVLAMPPSSLDMQGVRSMLRAAGVTAVSTLGLGILGYCLLWRHRSG